MNIKPFGIELLKLKTKGESFPVIEIVPGQIITRKLMKKVGTQQGVIATDIEADILKLVVIQRHKATGNIGLGMVKGFGLRKGSFGFINSSRFSQYRSRRH